jgi:hypothetical protein
VNCAVALEQLSGYLEGSLPSDEAQAVRRHLDTCAACASAATNVDAVVNALRAVTAEPLPAGFERAVRARLGREAPSPLRRFLIPALAGAALVLVSFGILHVTRPTARGPAFRWQTRQTGEAPAHLPAAPSNPAAGPATSTPTPETLGRAAGEAPEGTKPAFTPASPGQPAAAKTYADKAEGRVAQVERALVGAPKAPPGRDVFAPLTEPAEQPQKTATTPTGQPLVLDRATHEVPRGPAGPVGPAAGYSPAISKPASQAPIPTGQAETSAPRTDEAAAATAPRAANKRVAIIPAPASLPPGGRLPFPRASTPGWLAAARIHLAPRPTRAGHQAALVIDVPSQAQQQVERNQLQSNLRQSIAVQVRLWVRSLTPPAVVTTSNASTLQRSANQATTAYIPINVPAPITTGIVVPGPPRGTTYELTLSTQEGNSLSLLLFTSSQFNAAQRVERLRARPLDALSHLTNIAGVWLLTPTDIGTNIVDIPAGRPDDALSALLAGLGMDVHRNGRFWTAMRH